MQRFVKACHRRATSRSGFTLIEALAALLLITIVLPVVMRAVVSSAQVGVLADRRAEAVTLADTKLAEVLLNRDWKFGDAAGDFAEFYGDHARRYQWTLRIDDWNETAFSQVTVKVLWLQRGQEQAIELATVVYAEGL